MVRQDCLAAFRFEEEFEKNGLSAKRTGLLIHYFRQ